MDRKPYNATNTEIDIDDSKNENRAILNAGHDKKQWNKETVLGLVSVFIAVLLCASSKICVQALKADVPHFFLNALRCSTATTGMAVVLLYTRCLPTVDYTNLKPTVLYSICGTMYGLTVYISVVYIPLITQDVCLITASILSSLIIFGFIKKERVSVDQVSSTFS